MTHNEILDSKEDTCQAECVGDVDEKEKSFC